MPLSYLVFSTAVPAYAVGLINVTPNNIYPTYGAHNPSSYSECEQADCTYDRQPDDPTDPIWPVHWTSDWNMYRVFNKYAEFPPPYDGSPPAGLQDGVDYETSTGTTYYDSEWLSTDSHWPGVGAMRESYKNRCLPIFPINNQFSCSFISLGDTAIFQTYDQDRPTGMPEYCLFSPLNHPPRRNFISHLPYSKGDSAQLDNRIQGYSFWVSAEDGKPIQTGVSPDRTSDSAIMFGYAFWRDTSPDSSYSNVAPYRHPQSFYFSGMPTQPPNAPIVSQNYTDFSMRKPSSDTWSTVESLDSAELPACHLFQPN
ncbi:MAG: hypothetical protein F6K19_44700 [Cyanothece sp. SIO1E1]|nr:hypothetical protein [Cyanothece sp. SIO1E1]